MSGPANSRVQVKKTCICQLLNITCPILQGGMLWIATAELASAVSNAGGLGVISPLAAMGKDETISARDAIEMMTLRAAGVCRQEAFKGSISPGKLADMILVNRNPLKVSLEEIKALIVERTMRGGEFVGSEVGR